MPAPSGRPEPMTNGRWFTLSIGRNRRADPKWLLPLICKAGDVTKRDIGSIKIFDTETRFEIAADKARCLRRPPSSAMAAASRTAPTSGPRRPRRRSSAGTSSRATMVRRASTSHVATTRLPRAQAARRGQVRARSDDGRATRCRSDKGAKLAAASRRAKSPAGGLRSPATQRELGPVQRKPPRILIPRTRAKPKYKNRGEARPRRPTLPAPRPARSRKRASIRLD